MAAHQAQEHRIAAAEPLTRAATERRRNRTFQPVGCTGLPVLKCVALRPTGSRCAREDDRASWQKELLTGVWRGMRTHAPSAHYYRWVRPHRVSTLRRLVGYGIIR